MAIVINVPRDERFGDLGKGGGELLGALIERKRIDKDASVIAGVRAGGDVSSALSKVSPKNRAAVLSADAAFRADNPKSDFFQLDDAGKVVNTVSSVKAPEGFVSKEQFNANKERKPSDKSNAITDVLNTQIKDNPSFTNSSPAAQNRAARNIVNERQDITGFNRNLYDKLGDLTGDNRIRVDRRATYYSDYLRGENGKKLTLDKNRAFAMAKRDAEKDLKDFLKAQEKDSTLTAEDFFANGKKLPQEATLPDSVDFVPAGNKVSDDPLFGLKTLLGTIKDTPASADPAQIPAVDPNTGSEVTIVEPEIRVQNSTQAAVDANYPVQDNEEWVDVSDGLPLVPQSMMDVVKAGNAAAVAPAYASMAGIPLHVALALLKQNAGKAPIASLLKTQVIPDPPVPVPTAEELNRAAGGNQAPIQTAPPGNAPFPSSNNFVR